MNREFRAHQDEYLKALICEDDAAMRNILAVVESVFLMGPGEFEHLLLLKLASDLRREYTARINRAREDAALCKRKKRF